MSYEIDRRAMLCLSAAGAVGGASASSPIGTATLENIAVTTSTAANSAQYISDLVVKNVTVGGAPVSA